MDTDKPDAIQPLLRAGYNSLAPMTAQEPQKLLKYQEEINTYNAKPRRWLWQRVLWLFGL